MHRKFPLLLVMPKAYSPVIVFFSVLTIAITNAKATWKYREPNIIFLILVCYENSVS